MHFKGRSSIWKCLTIGVGKAPKPVDTEFRIFIPSLSTNKDGSPILECRTKKSTQRFKLTPGCCDILCPPNIHDKITFQFKQSNTFVLISSISPTDQKSLKFLTEYFSKGMHKLETDRIQTLIHNPYGSSSSTSLSLKPEPRQLTLTGSGARLNFQRRLRFNEDLQLLHISDQQLKLDGRIFVLENLQELHLENIGLNNERNQAALVNLCRLSNLKTLSFANNEITELSNDVLETIPTGLQHLILSDNKLTTLPRQLKRCTNLALLDARRNVITSIHEDVSKLRKLQVLQLENNDLQFLPYSMFYDRRFKEVNLTENPKLFNSTISHQQVDILNGNVPKLKYLTMSKMLNCSERSEALFPRHLKAEVVNVLHLCFLCMKYVPTYGSLNCKYAKFDVRQCSCDVYYNQSEILANYVAYVCLKCKPKAVKLKIF